ncbi:PPOX class F420-dependent oxidoreductase [Sinosporangium siamense]|uniref:PPOX class F420-dependent oxidoreductase n=1 Tax=Sinosporangium siamense TaxID=1367973 RepID=A0A919V6X0_9ACTN|nr:PPOX class F420-dependent oxidoreductase [Sinosporangium siamense]GII92898.1 PPOX class F420-dependent oxidoreductase [Sinosporangium siamense]
MAIVDVLGAEQYVSVTTYRRDGRAVPTPLWVAFDDGALVAWTIQGSGKVKRIRNNPRVLIAPCDVRGKVLGESVPGTAEVLPASETERVRRLIVKKYGMAARVLVLSSRLRRGRNGTVALRILLD